MKLNDEGVLVNGFSPILMTVMACVALDRLIVVKYTLLSKS